MQRENCERDCTLGDGKDGGGFTRRARETRAERGLTRVPAAGIGRCGGKRVPAASLTRLAFPALQWLMRRGSEASAALGLLPQSRPGACGTAPDGPVATRCMEPVAWLLLETCVCAVRRR